MQIGEYELEQPQNGWVIVHRENGSLVMIPEAAIERGITDAIDAAGEEEDADA